MCVYLPQSLSYIEIFLPSVVLLCWSNPAGKFSGTGLTDSTHFSLLMHLLFTDHNSSKPSTQHNSLETLVFLL